MGKAILIMVLGSLSIFAIVNLNINSNLRNASQTAINYYSDNQARNICNSMAQMLLAQLADSNSYRVSSPIKQNMFDGYASYTIKDTAVSGDSLIKVDVNGTFNRITKSVSVFAKELTSGFVPATVKAAITTSNPVETNSEINGKLVVDGRDHTAAGALIAGNGTLGIWTTSTLNQMGNSKIGGTDSGVDYAPAKPGNTNIISTNQIWPGGYPDTPDSLLGGTANGFPPGTLKGIALSGANGSQYTANPATLSFPLQGVTYVELPPAAIWDPVNIEGSGIFIIHNATKNAVIKNLNWGVFKGLIIADDVAHIHATIIGALIGITPTPSDGNCIGNGNGSVLYSSEVIKNATGLVMGGSTNNYGFGANRLVVTDWFEH